VALLFHGDCAKDQGPEEKVSAGLTRLNEEDPSFTVTNNTETKQDGGVGAGRYPFGGHLLKAQKPLGVEVDLFPAKVAYRKNPQEGQGSRTPQKQSVATASLATYD
jgi:translation elongation factor EF-G